MNEKELLELLKNEFGTHLKQRAREKDADLLTFLLNNKDFKTRFFENIAGALVFKEREFLRFCESYVLNKSFTRFKNKIGLSFENEELLKKNENTILNFPFKDCVLKGAQTKDDEKENELFFNEILAQTEIDVLFQPKALHNFELIQKENNKNIQNVLSATTPPPNFLIKGNNLLALHTLKNRADIYGKVKLIYIDPPYNTGNDSFNYNDNFNHSTWLCFMKNRLEIARDFLRDDGVIFVQCDDNEQAYLKVLMDEIFGRENFIANFIWQKKTGASDATHIAIITEYILCYAKNVFNLNLNKNTDSWDENRYKYSDEFVETRGKYYIDNLDRGGLSYSDSLNYAIECPDGSFTYPNGRKKYKNDGWIWKWSKNKFKWAIENNFIEFRKSDKKDSGWAVCYKNYMYVDNENKPIKRAAPYKNLILDVMNNHAAKEILSLFESKLFSTPKPEALLKRIIEISTQESDLVMDFFAGSGTTLAVAHKMKRRWVGIEQMDYIENITKERLKKVIDGEQGGISKAVNFNGGGSFVYCELMPLNAVFKQKIKKAKTQNDWDEIFEDLKQKAFVDYRIDIQNLLKDKDFFELNSTDKKEILFQILDKNMDYMLYTDIEDENYNIENEIIKLNNIFYGE